MAFDMPARQAFVIEITSRADLTNAISLNSSMVNGARIIGPSLAGVFMARYGVASCYLIDGLSFLAVIAGLLAMRLPKMEFVGTAAVFFFLLNLFKVPFMIRLGLITSGSFTVNLLLAPAVFAGAIVGRKLLPKINQRLFEGLALTLAVLASLDLMFKLSSLLFGKPVS